MGAAEGEVRVVERRWGRLTYKEKERNRPRPFWYKDVE